MSPAARCEAQPEPKEPLEPLPAAGLHWAAFWLLAAFYAVLFVSYYPPLCGIEDEPGFVNQAIVFSRGAISAESAGLHTNNDFVLVAGRHVPWRNPGRSLLLIPFLSVWGVRSIFVTGLAIHLSLAFMAAMIHSRSGQSPVWAALVMLHPTLAIYSRTIMGDTGAALFLTIALYFALYSRRPGIWTGLMVGCAALMRYQAGAAAPFFAAAIYFNAPAASRRAEALRSIGAAVLIGCAIAIYNLILFHNPLGWTHQGFFSPSVLPAQAGFYAQSLMLIWPGMLAVCVSSRSRLASHARWVCLPAAIFASFYYFHDSGSSWIETMVLGQRLIQGIIPILVICYCAWLSRVLAPWFRRCIGSRATAGACVLTLAVLCCVQAAMFRRHQDHLRKLESARAEVAALVPQGSLVIANLTLRKLFAIDAPGTPKYAWLPYDFEDRIFDHSMRLAGEQRPWHLAVLQRSAGRPAVPPDYLEKYGLTPVAVKSAGLLLFARSGAARAHE